MVPLREPELSLDPNPAGAGPFWTRSLAETIERLGASEHGLSSDAARAGLARWGPNELRPPRRFEALREIGHYFANPLVLILVVASAVSAAFGQVASAVIIALMLALSVALNFTLAYRSQQAADRLRQQVGQTAVVLRDGAPVSGRSGRSCRAMWCSSRPGTSCPPMPDCCRRKTSSSTRRRSRVNRCPARSTRSRTGWARRIWQRGQRRVPRDLGGERLGTALVVWTGLSTEFGRVAAALVGRPPETEFERGTRRFGFLILQVVIFLVLFAFLVNALLRRDLLESFLFSVALAVGLTPELLPMIVSVTLASGAVRMARRKVIVKQLAAIENFGSMDILLSDKTGTLTEGRISVDRHVNLRGESDETRDPARRPQQRLPDRAQEPDGRGHPPPRASGRRPVHTGRRDPVRLPAPLPVGGRGGGRPALAHHQGRAGERAAPLCVGRARRRGDAARRADAGGDRRPLPPAQRRGVPRARRGVPPGRGAGRLRGGRRARARLRRLRGLPRSPVQGVAETLAALRADGIEVKIVTGDNELVTQKICSQVGLDAGAVLLGGDIERMSDPALAAAAERTAVFARVSPIQKNRIVRALHARGHVVGVIGDGINDAPALRSADVGISVVNAVDVAKDAADIILLEKRLAVLHDGVVEGRRSFGNIMKYVLMGTSSNFGNMLSMAAASLFLPFLPMLPMQILLNNFLYDLSQVAIPSDRVDRTYMLKPKRWNVAFIRRYMLLIGPLSSIYDFLTFAVMLGVFHASEPLFRTGWFVESLATQTLVIFVIRTADRPWASRPSRALACSVVACAVVGALLPFTPLAPILGFVPLPPLFFGALLVMIVTYLGLVEVAKRWFYRRYPM